uniref:PI-PLC X domain-containing protein 1-like n=2 Tax=Sinocyclocheilus rhinocerous TaxID=307959 RepID=A0A673FRN3_9TELE
MLFNLCNFIIFYDLFNILLHMCFVCETSLSMQTIMNPHLFSGSHDAMSYCLDITSPLLRSESDTFRLLDGVFCCFTRPAIYRWATTQVQTIVEQLTAGIRYFDLRIAHKQYDSSNELYFTHVIYTHATVVETLQTVASWLESHPKEIIILACSHFEGLDYKWHEEFIYSLKKIFGSKLCPCNVRNSHSHYSSLQCHM